MRSGIDVLSFGKPNPLYVPAHRGPIRDSGLVLDLPLYKLLGSSFYSEDTNNHLCTVTGAIWGVTGRTFDGDDKIAFTSLVVGNPATIIVWAKKTTVATDKVILGDNASQNKYTLAHLGSAGADDFYLWTGSGSNYVRFAAIGLTTAWTMIAVTINGQTPRLYMNVTDKGAGAVTGTLGSAKIDTIGDKPVNDGTGWIGDIGEVICYSRLLSLTEIQYIYLSTKWRYS